MKFFWVIRWSHSNFAKPSSGELKYGTKAGTGLNYRASSVGFLALVELGPGKLGRNLSDQVGTAFEYGASWCFKENWAWAFLGSPSVGYWALALARFKGCHLKFVCGAILSCGWPDNMSWQIYKPPILLTLGAFWAAMGIWPSSNAQAWRKACCK